MERFVELAFRRDDSGNKIPMCIAAPPLQRPQVDLLQTLQGAFETFFDKWAHDTRSKGKTGPSK